ncbi:hypothetical protein [Polaribacter sp.]|uniref:hypothetical protein n=1 Tax=Polaribacter sp. TaxID=1920175 RepID=UPI003F6DA469
MIFTREKKQVWSLFEKISFRFLFLYFTLYTVSIFTGPLWKPMINWIGKSIFQITREFSSNGRGSGDTTYAYLLLFLFFCVAIISAFLWSIIDKKRKSYNQLQYGFLVFIRIIVIFFMLNYGFVKIFHLQMSEVSNADLIKNLGDKSPMGLAWTFMGFSKTYSFFAGLAEVTAGLLLLFRRTQTFGAIATVVVMLNVFMMNLCFDIPVKIFSFHLMLMGLLLLLADAKRVFGVLLLNKNITNYTIYPKLNKEETRIIAIVKLVLVVLTCGLFIFTSYTRYKKQYIAPKTALFGVWKVTTFKKGTDIAKKDFTKQWKYIAIDRAKMASIKNFDDQQNYYTFIVDTIKNTVVFGDYKSENLDTLQLINKDSIVTLAGKIKTDTVFIKLQKKKAKDFLINSRGFHWVNEFPLNR